MFVDGTKIRANAGRGNSHDQAYYEKLLMKIDSRIDQLITECEATDRSEEGTASYIRMEKELAQSRNLKERVREALNCFTSEDKKKVNQTDPDCAILKSIQGSHAGYNVQTVVDDEHGLIIHSEAVSDTNDLQQFARQIDQANELLQKPCEAACADAGYANTTELAKIDEQGITVIVPSKQQASSQEEGPFSKSHFKYDEELDCYICPEGHSLSYYNTDWQTGKRRYRANKKDCSACRYYGQCTEAKCGRTIARLPNEKLKLKLEAQYQEASSQSIYARRKTRVEHPFGHIKRNLKTDAFHLRGQQGVQAETSLLAACFNIVRMMTIIGVSGLIKKLVGIRMVSAAY